MVVDRPWACFAAPWFDLVTTSPSVRMQGGPPPADVLAGHHPLARDADAVTSVLAALAGYLVRGGRQPPPPGLPALRAFRKA